MRLSIERRTMGDHSARQEMSNNGLPVTKDYRFQRSVKARSVDASVQAAQSPI